MTANATHVAMLRRMGNEPAGGAYSDDILEDIIERYPLPDTEGRVRGDTGWGGDYDLNHAAADLWGEKAAALAGVYDFSADGATYNRSQAYEQALSMQRKYQSQRAARGVRFLKVYTEDTELWQV